MSDYLRQTRERVLWIATMWTGEKKKKPSLEMRFTKDTSGMFLLHGRLGRVDGFTDAAQLQGEHRTGVNPGLGLGLV